MFTSQESTVSLIESITGKCPTIAIKKLSNNDRRWADSPDNGHQYGPYIPVEWRSNVFFPNLINVNHEKPHIFEHLIETCWVRTGEIKESRLVHYSNKNTECHLTRVVKSEFAGIGPASWFLVGKPDDGAYCCLVIDSADIEGSAYLETLFDLDSDFEYNLFETGKNAKVIQKSFIDEILKALAEGTTAAFVAGCTFPKTSELAELAQKTFLAESGLADLNPYRMACPGDALMRVSRDIEYRLFRYYTTRHYSAKLMHMLAGGKTPPDLATVVAELVNRFDEIYKEVMVSAGQRSKSRAGYSFEQHVQRMLTDGGIPFQEQKFIGNQRPDFILPSQKVFKDPSRTRDDAFILSLKTLLRERWKQVLAENKASDLFLGTVDDGIAQESLREMKDHGIYLVVPESLKGSEYSEYEHHDNVITFKEFFEVELKKRQNLWILRGMKVQFND